VIKLLVSRHHVCSRRMTFSRELPSIYPFSCSEGKCVARDLTVTFESRILDHKSWEIYCAGEASKSCEKELPPCGPSAGSCQARRFSHRID